MAAEFGRGASRSVSCPNGDPIAGIDNATDRGHLIPLGGIIRGEEERVDRVILAIDGMSCGHCVRAVTEALTEVPGVRVERVTIGSAELAYDPATASVDDATRAIAEAGYSARRA